MHIFFSVGEPSGDLHASKLVRELQSRSPGLECTAFGGPLMEVEGCKLVYRLTDLAVMGILRVIPLLWRFYLLVRQARQYFKKHRPDAVILVDFPGFNWWIARAARSQGIPVFYYLPPQLWAWAPWRVRRMQKFVNHVLCCLPFEPAWYLKRGVHAEFVGHPFFDEVRERELDVQFMAGQRKSAGLNVKTVAILPGSRNHEVEVNFPLQIDVMNNLQRSLPNVRFLVASYKESQRRHCEEMLAKNGTKLDVQLHVGHTSEILEASDVCLMVSGSVSLEVLARKTPAVVLYRGSRIFSLFCKVMLTCRYFSLPNLIADSMVMPEFGIAGNPKQPVDEMSAILLKWLTDPQEHRHKVAQLTVLANEVAQSGATAHAAAAILKRLGVSRKRSLSPMVPRVPLAAA